MKGVLRALAALLIIAGGAGLGYVVANNTDLGRTSALTTTPTAVAALAVTFTPIPTFTPAFGSTPGAGAGVPGQGGRNGNPAGANAGTTPGAASPAANTSGASQRPASQNQRNQVAGTVVSFKAATKTLTISTQDGSTRNILVTNSIFTRADKISLDDISKASSPILLIQGERGTDGIYSARTVTLIDPAAAQGQGQAGRAFAGGGNGGTGAAGGAPGGLVVLNGATVNGSTLNGKSFQGEELRVNVSDTTSILKQGTATAEDLTEGKRVTITGQPNAAGDIEATLVAISA